MVIYDNTNELFQSSVQTISKQNIFDLIFLFPTFYNQWKGLQACTIHVNIMKRGSVQSVSIMITVLVVAGCSCDEKAEDEDNFVIVHPWKEAKWILCRD